MVSVSKIAPLNSATLLSHGYRVVTRLHSLCVAQEAVLGGVGENLFRKNVSGLIKEDKL